MVGKFIQIATMSESDRTKASVWALTDAGEIYFFLLREGKWVLQDGPPENTPLQPNDTGRVRHDT